MPAGPSLTTNTIERREAGITDEAVAAEPAAGGARPPRAEG
jgi:hypothetical protein